MKMRLAGLLFSVVSFTPLVLATTFIERPFPEAVKDAPVIVRGKIGMTYTDWGFDQVGGRQIYTYTELQVDEVLKGEAQGATVMMRELGGEKDGVGMQVSGTAKFQRGEEVVMFLGSQNPDASFDVRGMMMGKFNLVEGPNGEEILKGPALSSHSGHVHREKNGGQADTQSAKKWTLTDLKTLIRDQAGESGAPTQQLQAPEIAEDNVPPPVVDESQLADSRPAPPLQPVESGDVGASSAPTPWLMVILLGGGLILALGLGFLLIKRRH